MKGLMKHMKQRSPHEGQILKNKQLKLYDLITEIEECVTLLQNAFIYHNVILLDECKEKIAAVIKSSDALVEDMEHVCRVHPDMKPYAGIPGHLSKIGNHIEKLSECIYRKISENILFSDKAAKETIFLLQRLNEILAPTADIVLARNTFLSMYVEESQAGVEKRATEYATLHEDRLIEGVCLPVSSSLYITMLESIKKIAWHAKQITINLAWT